MNEKEMKTRYKCSQCDKWFLREKKLKRHQRTHFHEANLKGKSFEDQMKVYYDLIKDNLNPPFLNQHETIYMLIETIGSQEKNKNPKHVLAALLYHVGAYFLGNERWTQKILSELLDMSENTLRTFIQYIQKKHGEIFRPPIYTSK